MAMARQSLRLDRSRSPVSRHMDLLGIEPADLADVGRVRTTYWTRMRRLLADDDIAPDDKRNSAVLLATAYDGIRRHIAEPRPSAQPTSLEDP